MEDLASFAPMNNSASQQETAFARYASKTDHFRPEEIESVLAGRALRETDKLELKLTRAGFEITIGTALSLLSWFAEYLLPALPARLHEWIMAWGVSAPLLDRVAVIFGAITTAIAIYEGVRISGVIKRWRLFRETARTVSLHMARERMIHPGSHQVTIRLGENGMRFDANRYELRFKWSGFSADPDHHAVLAARTLLNAGDPPPLPGRDKLERVSLEEFVESGAEYEAKRDYLEDVRRWCREHSFIDLPLLPDEEAITREHNRRRKEAERANAPPPRRADIAWIDFVRVPRRFFADGSTPGSSELSWEAFVAGALFRIVHAGHHGAGRRARAIAPGRAGS